MKNLFYILAVAVLLSACSDPFLGQNFVTTDEDETLITNAAYLEKRSDEFSLWIELLKYADLYNALNDASTTTTVFAPDNNAMKAFMEFKGITSVKELDFEYAREIVKVHLLRSALSESSFMVYVNTGEIQIPTVFGTFLSTSYGYLDNDVDDAELVNVVAQDTLSIYLNNQAKVLESAHQTVNGMVYVLGGVVRPLSENIVEKLRDYGEYGIFLAALEATGWADSLSVCADTVYHLDGSFSVNVINYTCFAVPDQVYKASGINDLGALASRLGAGTNYTDSANTLRQYLAYHLMDSYYHSSSLLSFEEDGQTKIYDTRLKHQVFTIASGDDGKGLINGDTKFIRTNITAENGIIHKVDQLMVVYEPEPVTVIWDFCNSSDIISIVNSYGADPGVNLGNLYTTPLTSKEVQVDLSEDRINGDFGTVSSFTYFDTTSKTSYTSWRKVGFMKCKYKSAKEQDVNSYGAYLNNLFILNLGYTGWIQMQTPTLIKGKYKVELFYAGTAALQSYYAAGSLVKFTLDDYLKNLYVWKGMDSKAGSHIRGDVLFEEVEFETSGTHTFKAVMMDLNASTKSPYRQMWDYVKFTPITE